MRIRPLSRDEVRSIDARAEELGLPTIALMENAGGGAADLLRSRLEPGAAVHILCGSGNNGGDGGVVARRLDAWGFAVQVCRFGDPTSLRGDAAVQRTIIDRSGIPTRYFDAESVGALDSSLAQASWLVDGLLGTGLTRPVEGLLADAIDAMNRSGKPILALDLPSGLDADTGLPLGRAVRASATATFVAPKIGFGRPGASDFTGEVYVVEIGAPGCVLESYRDR